MNRVDAINRGMSESATLDSVDIPSLKGKVSDEEWAIRVDLAAAEGFGSLKSGQLEGSNVDITEELVNLIAAQRNFQANSKALDTANQVSQTIIQIRN